MNKTVVIMIDPEPYAFGQGMGDGCPAKKNVRLTLEHASWQALDEICAREQSSIHAICTIVYHIKSIDVPFDMAVRLFIIDYFRGAATEDGHVNAGHGSMFRPVMPSVCLH